MLHSSVRYCQERSPSLVQARTRKAEQAAETRNLLVQAARELFGERGFASTSIDEIAERVGVTTGGVYHHFADKRELFRAVHEEIERELAEAIIRGIEARSGAKANAWEQVRAGGQAFLDACMDPGVQHVIMLEAPSVLGWDSQRDIARYGLGLIRQGLERSIKQGLIEPQPVEPLAHLLRAALTEGGMLLARAEDQKDAREEIGAAVDRLIDGLRRSQTL
jgi:AcrR family transcriptional regulator